MAGAGDVQMGGALRRERRWGADTNIERDTEMNGCLWRGGRTEEGKELLIKTVESGGAGGLDIKFVMTAKEPRCGGVNY